MARLPKPFQRPAMSLEVPGAKREWREVRAGDLAPGDIVQGHNRGQIAEGTKFSEQGVSLPGQRRVCLVFKNGAHEDFDPNDAVTAFVEVGRGNSI